jgi:hypothetical protein
MELRRWSPQASTQTANIFEALEVGSELRARAGGRLGRVDDMIVRLGEESPPVSGLLATVADRQVCVRRAGCQRD